MNTRPRFIPPPEPGPPRLPEEREGSLFGWIGKLLSRFSSTQIERGAVVAVLGLGVLQHLIETHVLFSLFYLLPIAAAAWFGRDRAGYFLCGLAAAAWWLAVALGGGEPAFAGGDAVNAGVHLALFLLVAALTARLRAVTDERERLALRDPLTGLANTRAFLKRMGEEIDRALRYGGIFTVAYLDLDDFKRVNDSMGHAEGDRALRQMAEVMKDITRSTDVAARLGGDEFAILLPETPYAQAEGALEKLRHRVGEAMAAGGWPVTLSIGAVTFEAPVDSADEAIRLADRLMYEVKAEGRDGIRHILWTGEDAGTE